MAGEWISDCTKTMSCLVCFYKMDDMDHQKTVTLLRKINSMQGVIAQSDIEGRNLYGKRFLRQPY